MSEPIETTRAAPDVPIDAPTMTEDERRQFYQSERERYQAEIDAIRVEARLEVQREMAKERRSMQLTAWAQDTTAATLERPYAIPIEAKDLSAFAIALDAFNPKLTEQFQGFMGRILDAGLIDFREIGSQGGADEREISAKEAFDAAVVSQMKNGNLTRMQAMDAVRRDQPDVYEAYHNESSRRGAVAAPAKATRARTRKGA